MVEFNDKFGNQLDDRVNTEYETHQMFLREIERQAYWKLFFATVLAGSWLIIIPMLLFL